MKNRYMTKILSTFIALSLVISSFATVFAADSSVPDCEKEAKILTALGVLESDDSALLSKEVNRGLAAHYLAKFMNVSTVSVGGKFSDVTPDTAYAAEIETLTNMGIIHGNGDGTFSPERPMLLQEFIKMLISAMGYSIPASAQGGYPYGFIQYASSLDITSGLESFSYDKTFSIGTMAVMLYNALDVPVMTTEGFSNDGSVSVTTNKDTTALTSFLRCYSGEGQITTTEKGGLTSSETYGNGTVVIDGVVYHNAPSDASELLGYSVEYYYRENGTKRELVCAYPSDTNKVLVLDADSIDGYAGLVISYTDENGDFDEIKLNSSTDIVYNYRPAAPVKAEDIMIDNGTVTVIDCDGNNSADAVIVKSYRTVYARSIDYYGKLVYDEYNSASPLNLKESGDKIVSIYDRKGNKATIESLEADSLLSCIVSRDGGYMEIREIVDEVIGKVESIETTNGDTLVTIGKKTYGVCAELEKYGLKFSIGDKIICYLDLNGEIGVVRDDMVSRERWGYLEGVTTTGSLETTAMVRIMEDGGNGLTVLDCASKLRFNGDIISTASAQSTNLKPHEGSVIRYALNSDGKVAVLKTIGNGFVEAYKYPGGDDRGLWWDSSISIFGGKIGATDDTTVFLIPDNGDASKYVCSTVNKSCSHYKYYKLSAYKISEDKLIADVVTFEVASTRGSSVGDQSPVMMVDAIRVTQDADGEPRKQISGYVDGSPAAYFVEDDSLIERVPGFDGTSATGSYQVKRGDLVQFQLDSEDVIIDARILCRAWDNMNIFGRPHTPTNGYNDNNRVMKGYVYQTDGTFFSISPTMPTESTVLESPEIYPVLSTIGVYVYYPSTDTVKVGSMADFLPYMAVGSGCSEVVAFMTGSDMMAVVLCGE